MLLPHVYHILEKLKDRGIVSSCDVILLMGTLDFWEVRSRYIYSKLSKPVIPEERISEKSNFKTKVLGIHGFFPVLDSPEQG